MKKWLGVLGLAALLGGCVTHQPIPNLSGSLLVGQPISLTLPSWPSGKPHALKADLGHVVLLDVWATWCTPCRETLPLYQDLEKQYGPKGLEVLTINVDDDASNIADFLKATRVSLPVLRDPGGKQVQARLEVNRMPTTFFIDREGIIRYVDVGFSGDSLEKYEAQIKALLEGPST